MELQDIYNKIKSQCDGASLQQGELDPSVVVPKESLKSVLAFCKQDPELKFDCLQCQTATHEGEQFNLFYHLFSYTHRHRLVVQAATPVADAKAESVTSIWRAANWLERETFDLFGIHFEGHPDLRRIMLPEDWEGHPLRKDYATPLHYNGMDNSPSEITKSFMPTDRGEDE